MSGKQISATRIIAACKGLGQQTEPKSRQAHSLPECMAYRPWALLTRMEEAHIASRGNSLKMSPGYTSSRFE